LGVFQKKIKNVKR